MNVDRKYVPTTDQVFDVWMAHFVSHAGPSEKYDRGEGFWAWLNEVTHEAYLEGHREGGYDALAAEDW